MYYNLIVLIDLALEDGRIYLKGHDAKSLSRLEVKDLITNYPDHFKAADDITQELIASLDA